MICYVYWIYNDTCLNISTCGYIGVSQDAHTRFKTHLHNSRVPLNSTFDILFKGTREECFNLEKTLRPTKNIGWNNAVGGSHGWRIGFVHSDTTKNKLKIAWSDTRKKKASDLSKVRNSLLIGQKRPKQSIAISGIHNPMYGKSRPQYVKDAISLAHKNKEPYNKQDNYCPYCNKRVSLSIMKKYHGKNKKACI